MTVLDTKFRSLASNLLNKFGKEVTIVIKVDGSETGTQEIKGFLTNWTSKEVEGTLIKMTDSKLLIAQLDLDNASVELKTNDRIEVDSNRYKVIDIPKVWSGEQVTLLKVAIRK